MADRLHLRIARLAASDWVSTANFVVADESQPAISLAAATNFSFVAASFKAAGGVAAAIPPLVLGRHLDPAQTVAFLSRWA
jgi:hypothetical protein